MKLLVAALVSTSAALAQVQAGRIVGTVFDPQRAAVPGAIVNVTEISTNHTNSATTNQVGDFVITPLNPGLYNIVVTMFGFQTVEVNRVEVVVGQSARVDVELRIGEAATKVEVTTVVPLLNTEAGTLGQVLTNTQIVDLPLNGRGFYELARLTPGAALLPATGNVQKVRPEFVNGNVISGVRGSQTSFLLDGVDVTEQHQGGTWIQTSIDALQEFSVQQNAYTAEFARAGGAFNATTKSGTNAFHGSLFEFLRNDKLDSRNFFAKSREILKRNQFGGTFGGPVVIPRIYNGKDKTFFFVSYEGMRQRQGQIFNSNVPTQAELNGDFSAPGLNRIYDPLSTAPNPTGSGNVRTLFVGNKIPRDRLSSQALYFNKYIPSPNTAAGTFVYAPSTALDTNQLTLRLDREVTQKHRAFVRVSIHRNVEDDPGVFPELGSTHLEGPAQNVAVALTSNLRPTMVHEFRFSYMYGEYRSTAYFQGQGAQFNKEAGITDLVGVQDPSIASLPTFAWSGYTGFAGNAGDGRPKWQNRWVYEFSDNLTWIKGKHIIKFGTRIHYFKPLFTDSRNHNGSYSYTGIMSENPASTTGTGDSFADWMLGYPASVTRGNPATWWGGSGIYWHFFFQDDVKISEKLTVNLGLRYEYTPWLTGYRNQAATFDPTQAKPIIVSSDSAQIDLAAQPAAPVGYALYKDLIQTTSQAGLPLTVTNNDTRQFAPRVGLAWRPFGENTVIRGGYGIFYESEGTSGRLNFNFLPFQLAETVNADRGVTPTRTTANFFLGAPFGSAVTAVNWLPVPIRARMGYDQHWNFGVQRQFLRTALFEVEYVGNKGSFLNDVNNINYPAAGAGTIQTRRPYPRFGTIGYNTQDMSSTYHALQVKLEKRLSASMWYLVSYTFSKSISTAATPAVGGNYGWEKALSSFDVPHVLAISAGYQLPFGKGKAFLSGAGPISDNLLGGWQLQGIINFRSGLPYTPTISRDVANTGIGSQRPNRIGSGSLANPSLAAYFDKSAFVVPAAYSYGNSGGDILRGDYSGTVDLSLFKQFSLTERMKLQFRAEVFNLPNAAYFNAPSTTNTNIDSASGGQITSTSNNPRQIQFGLKLNF